MSELNKIFIKGYESAMFELKPFSNKGEDGLLLVAKQDIELTDVETELSTEIPIAILANFKFVMIPMFGERMDFVPKNPKASMYHNHRNKKTDEVTTGLLPPREDVPKVKAIPENINPLPNTYYGRYEGNVKVRFRCKAPMDVIKKGTELYKCLFEVYGFEQG